MRHERLFRFSPGKIAWDEAGLRVGGVALLSREAGGAWSSREVGALSRELSQVYGFPVSFESKQAGLAAVARALVRDDLPQAQIAALLLRLPDPPQRGRLSRSERQGLSDALADSGMLDSSCFVEFAKLAATSSIPPSQMQHFGHSKYNFNPNEPRNRYGEWTNEGDAGNADERDVHVEDAAYQGDFHDEVARDEIEHYRNAGAVCVSELRLALGAVTARVDILCRGKTG